MTGCRHLVKPVPQPNRPPGDLPARPARGDL